MKPETSKRPDAAAEAYLASQEFDALVEGEANYVGQKNAVLIKPGERVDYYAGQVWFECGPDDLTCLRESERANVAYGDETSSPNFRAAICHDPVSDSWLVYNPASGVYASIKPGESFALSRSFFLTGKDDLKHMNAFPDNFLRIDPTCHALLTPQNDGLRFEDRSGTFVKPTALSREYGASRVHPGSQFEPGGWLVGQPGQIEQVPVVSRDNE